MYFFLLLVPRSGYARLPTSVELCSGTAPPVSCTQTELSDICWETRNRRYDVACADKCSTLYIGHRFLQYTGLSSINSGRWTSTSTQDFDTQMSRSSHLPALRRLYHPLYLLFHTCDF